MIGVQLVEVELAEILPMVIGLAIRRDGQPGFLLVEQDLEQYVLILRILSIEDPLDIGCHGEHVEVDPTVHVEILEVIKLAIEAIEP